MSCLADLPQAPADLEINAELASGGNEVQEVEKGSGRRVSEQFRKPEKGILRGITLRESLRSGGKLWRSNPQQLRHQRAKWSWLV